MDPNALKVVQELFKDAINMKSVEYFADNNWLKLPASWRRCLETSSNEDVVEIVMNSSFPKKVLPLSMLCLKKVIDSTKYTRKMVGNPDELEEKWLGTASCSNEKTFRVITCGEIRKKIKVKKQHEINRIVKLVSQLQRNWMEGGIEIDSLVDIGAGVGHLSRIIHLNNNLEVMAVEGNEEFTVMANSLDEKILGTPNNPEYKTTPQRFTAFVTEDLAEKIDNFSKNGAILIGLHTCGDFSSTVLKVFEKSRKAKSLVLLGCCYHKEYQSFQFYRKNGDVLEEMCEKISSVFPLSRKWRGCELNYVSREMACHNNENLGKNLDFNIARYARAHLEKWIWKISENPEDRNIGMCSVKCDPKTTKFGDYVQKAMSKRGLHLMEKLLERIEEEENDILNCLVDQLDRHYFEKTDMIRMLFAPFFESIIVDDRLHFLIENGCFSKVVPIFDPVISPRNLAIVSNKF